jgi:uncharacterized cupin superfamily protein
LRAGDCATFPKGTGNGRHLINKSSAMAAYLEVGSRNPVVGATKLNHLDDAVTAVSVELSSEEVDRLEEPYRPHPLPPQLA